MKYLVIGDYVISKIDSQRHYVNAYRLCQLYGVNTSECIMIEQGREEDLRGRNLENLIILRPRYNGNYKLKSKP